MDSFCHALEAFVSRKSTPYTDILARSAMQRIASNIERVYLQPSDIVAREQMMLAATEAGLAFSNSSVALVHGLSAIFDM